MTRKRRRYHLEGPRVNVGVLNNGDIRIRFADDNHDLVITLEWREAVRMSTAIAAGSVLGAQLDGFTQAEHATYSRAVADQILAQVNDPEGDR